MVVVFIGIAFFMPCVGALLYLPGSEESRIRTSYLRFLGRNKDSEVDEWAKLKEEVKEANGEFLFRGR